MVVERPNGLSPFGLLRSIASDASVDGMRGYATPM
jgi:hypothetical protein